MSSNSEQSVFEAALQGLRPEVAVGTYERRLDPTFALFATVTNPESLPGLLLRVEESPAFKPSELRNSDRVELEFVDRNPGAEIVLRTNGSEASEIFITLANDLVPRVLSCESEMEAAALFVRRFNMWRRFLKQTSSGLLSARKQLGLYGELSTLRDVLIPALGPLAAVDAWTGPDNAPQDFQAERIAIEVKSIVHSEPQILRIDGERQLDDFGFDALLLAHHRVFRQRGSGQTLPEIVGEVRTIVASVPTAEVHFDDKLLAYGYAAGFETTEYGEVGYGIRETSHYRVRQGFPRLTESDLLPGMGALEYSITAAVCDDYAVDQALVVDWIKTPEAVVEPATTDESTSVEYKETAWTPVGDTHNDEHYKKVSSDLQTSVVKTVVALLNSGGGELVIGVRDSDHVVTGIRVDLEAKGFESDDRDAFERMLVTLLRNQIDQLVHQSIRVTFIENDSQFGCHVAVAPSPNPRFGRPLSKESGPVFWVRAGNSTEALEGNLMLDYINANWR